VAQAINLGVDKRLIEFNACSSFSAPEDFTEMAFEALGTKQNP